VDKTSELRFEEAESTGEDSADPRLLLFPHGLPMPPIIRSMMMVPSVFLSSIAIEERPKGAPKQKMIVGFFFRLAPKCDVSVGAVGEYFLITVGFCTISGKGAPLVRH
jgi:hypothetical protein